MRRTFPKSPIYLSTSTTAGRKTAETHATSIVSGVFYLPFDYVSCVRAALRTIRPALLIILETEIWPNLYSEVRRAGASLAVVNGRISNRAWPRYLAWKHVFTPILQLPNLVLVQSELDGKRYAELGVPIERLRVEANLKYDAAFPQGATDLRTFGANQIWISASTVGPNERGSIERHAIDEDDIVLDAFQTLKHDFPSLLLIIAPRQRDRFEQVAHKLERAGISFVRRTQSKNDSSIALQLPGVLLLDTIGELAKSYTLADVVFVGGSLAPRGGHNIIEPAAAGAPVVIGPNMQNFETIAQDFLAAEAVVQIQREDELASAIRDLLLDRQRAAAMGARARRLVTERRGVAVRVAHELRPHYERGNYKRPHNLLISAVLRGLGWLWREGGIINRRRSEKYASSVQPLPVPVISIGGITVGGSGKTPFTGYLVAQLRKLGYSPAILTRGYRRRSPAKSLVFAPGMKVTPAFTGDEAQIFLRDGIAPIGIGAERYETAKILLSQFPATDILLLDDGFQHARLRRDIDVVVIDGLDPLGQEEIVPLGRLRESPTALERADVLVVTRAETNERYNAVKKRLREYNRTAPVFRTRVVARRWRDSATSEFSEPPSRKIAAFCGLGNPRNFWQTLEALGFDIVFRWSFPDHHTYQPAELQRLAFQARLHGADILVTTEKDRINCPPKVNTLVAPLQLLWVEIDLELEDEAGFFALLETHLRSRSAA